MEADVEPLLVGIIRSFVDVPAGTVAVRGLASVGGGADGNLPAYLNPIPHTFGIGCGRLTSLDKQIHELVRQNFNHLSCKVKKRNLDTAWGANGIGTAADLYYT